MLADGPPRRVAAERVGPDDPVVGLPLDDRVPASAQAKARLLGLADRELRCGEATYSIDVVRASSRAVTARSGLGDLSHKVAALVEA
jgi:hypothetical protein